ncbi:MAG: FlgD immunoglobulin-like domain containing protein [Candidatus Kapaibacterium sp.]
MKTTLAHCIARTKVLVIALFVCSSMMMAQKMQHAEMLARPTDKEITVHVIFNDPAEACVVYGTTRGNYTKQTAWQPAPADSSTEIVLTKLQPNTQYYYRLVHRVPGSKDSVLRPEYTFHTARPKGETFSFIVQADPHADENSDTTLYKRCLQNQLEDKPDFMVDLGDIIMSDKLKNAAKQITHDTITQRCHLMRSFYEVACHSMPLMISLGNHEGEAGWNLNNTPNNVAIYTAVDRNKYMLNPFPNDVYTGDTTMVPYVGKRGDYYAWTWGEALFIVLDPYWYTPRKPDSLNGWRWTLGKVQYDWLRATLEKSDAKFKFVFAHQLIGGDANGRGGVEYANKYEWGGGNIDGTPGFAANRPGWYKPIKDLFKENRVTIFFHGHDHFFCKQQKDCLIYQETPQPSLPNFTNASQADDYGYFEGQVLPNSGHLRVTVSPDGTRVDYVRVYLPANETTTRKNKDVSATYYIGARNCYDSLTTSVPTLWNANYTSELVFPNPTDRITTVRLRMQSTEEAEIRICDAQGNVIRHLLRPSVIEAGEYDIVWDGTTDSGEQVANGSYWSLVRSDRSGEVRSSKIMYVR